MKTLSSFALLVLSSGLACAQMPTSFDASGRSAQNNGDGSSAHNPNDATQEQQNPQLMGMEMPLLDPSSDTVKYNGGFFDVGNNAAVRARFEKYLQQMPENSQEAKRYRSNLKAMQQEIRKSDQRKEIISSAVIMKVGRTLHHIADYDMDGGQSDALASAMITVLGAQRATYRRDKQNEKLDKEIDVFLKDANKRTNANARRKDAATRNAASSKDGQGSNNASGAQLDLLLIAKKTKDMTEAEAVKQKNDTDGVKDLALAKLNYQSQLMFLLMQRRFDHCSIGSAVYRHLFNEGDAALKGDKNSKFNKFFTDLTGMPPTINAVESFAKAAKNDVDESMEAVNSLLAQNKLAAATQRLIEAVAVGEYMESVVTFPTASRSRIYHYWNLRKRVLSALNSRDYGTCEEIAKEMKALDSDFDDSLVLTYCEGRKNESDLYLRSAKKALMAGDEATYAEEARKAATVWPRNPNIAKARTELDKFDSYDPVKEEFQKLYERKDYRTICKEQDRFKVVAIDPKYEESYKEAITLVSKMDAMFEYLDRVAKQDKIMGPCSAYETLLEEKEKEPRYADDVEYKAAIAKYENLAHAFVSALRDAKDCEARREIGSALSNYCRAMTIYPKSNLATAGANRLRDVIMSAKY